MVAPEAVCPKELVASIRGARTIGVITGAGISAASGIPTYRGRGGVYDDPVEGDRIVEALSGPVLRSDPDRTWEAIGRIARAARNASPNAAHRALVDLEHHAKRLVILTQNVDGLHEAAGSTDVIDIHGNVSRTLCTACGATGPAPDWDTLEGAPRCGACGGVLRPDVVLFGEMLPPAKVQRVYREFVHGAPDVVLAVGTSALFPYIAEPLQDAAAHGRCTVEINTEPTLLSGTVRHRLQGPADVVLPALVSAVIRG